MNEKTIEPPLFARENCHIDSAGKYSFFPSRPSFPIKPQPISFKTNYLDGKVTQREAKDFLIQVACRVYTLYQKLEIHSSFNAELLDFQRIYAAFHVHYCESKLNSEEAENEAIDLLENFPEENNISFENHMRNWIYNLINPDKKRARSSSGITSVETVEEEEDTFLSKKRCLSSEFVATFDSLNIRK